MEFKYNLEIPDFMEAKEAAEKWGISDSRIRQRINEIPYGQKRKFGKQWVVTKEGMEAVFGRPKSEEDIIMQKLTPVSYVYKRYPTSDEQVKEAYLIKDEFISELQTVRTKLKENHRITLEEARNLYSKLVAKVKPKSKEQILKLEIDLTEYLEYKENGEPVFGSEENPVDRHDKVIAYYNPEHNVLDIYKNDFSIYQNYNGDESGAF